MEKVTSSREAAVNEEEGVNGSDKEEDGPEEEAEEDEDSRREATSDSMTKSSGNSVSDRVTIQVLTGEEAVSGSDDPYKNGESWSDPIVGDNDDNSFYHRDSSHGEEDMVLESDTDDNSDVDADDDEDNSFDEI